MLFGIVGKSLIQDLRQRLPRLIGEKHWEKSYRIESASLFLCFDNGTSAFDEKKDRKFWVSSNRTQGVVWDGDIYNWEVLRKQTGGEEKGKVIWHLFQKNGNDFGKVINGDFAMVVWDESEGMVCLIRDRMGVIPLYYGRRGREMVFGTNLRTVAAALKKTGDFYRSAIEKYLVFCYNPGNETFFSGIERLRPAHTLLLKDGTVSIKRYWDIRFASQKNVSEADTGEQIREKLNTAVLSRMNAGNSSTGAFLSGGLDSSSVVSLLHRAGHNLTTYSFRCKGESFDESPYAKKVAEFVNATHHIVEYAPEDILLAKEMVCLMDEPFCDVGINIGTYLLAKHASDEVTDLFTGDGGDELFAGHPVYVADNMARLFGWIPRPILSPIFALGRLLPDSEKKKDWKVKIKRFSESYVYPNSLGTHRWRSYYMPGELSRLLSEKTSEAVFEDMVRFNREADCEDALSRSLYSDYQTVVQFYLRRMGLVRSFGLKPKMPMLDGDLVSYCATIPSKMKIHGFSDVKYIERIAVDPLLPHDVVYRKDKLGHSIPLKNWLRENTQVKQFVFDLLSDETLKRRGLFNSVFVDQMKNEHLNRSRNHSHRLWALAIFELWMRSIENNNMRG